MPPHCCRCNGKGRCKGCVCVRRGTVCTNCTPSSKGRCENLRRERSDSECPTATKTPDGLQTPLRDERGASGDTRKMELKESGKTSLVHARQVMTKIEKRNLKEAKVSCANAEWSAGKHKKEIETQIERYTVVEEHYRQQERKLIASINDVVAQEESVGRQKSATEVQLSCERNELSQLRTDLSAAVGHLSYLQRKRRRARRRRRRRFAVARVMAGAASFGIATPVAGALATVAGVAAATSGRAERSAEEKIRMCQSRINDTERKVRESQNKISSFSSTLAKLGSEKSRYLTERHQLEEKKGKIKEVIAFLLDAQRYWSQFTITTDECIIRTALSGNIVVKAEARGYNLFDSKKAKRVLATFKEAWDAFEEMNENCSNYNFEIDFQCTQCSNSFHEFPHVKNGQLICSSCHE